MNYDVNFCGCGHIHVLPYSEFSWMTEDPDNRNIIRICKNCGIAYNTFLERYENGFIVRCVYLKDGMNEFTKNTRIYYSDGIEVYMKSGKIANVYESGYFFNLSEWNYDIVDFEYADSVRHDSITVNTKKLIDTIRKEYKENADDILKCISSFKTHIHWENTEYCTEGNK